jgi:ParB family chromosome partitioning protein
MTKRREAMERLLQGGAAPAVPQGAGAPVTQGAGPAAGVRAGAVRTMGLALEGIGAAEAVEEIDAALCEPSFVRDRLEDDEEAGIAALAESIAEGGQAVPILVRPHPAALGRYQIAYGHRRWVACRRLGRPVRAIVRPLDDDALVVAQGRENNERRDLTFIERAEFAAALRRRGVPRAVIGRALAVDKSELARLLAVADGLPDGLARAIGRAPKAGRPRWLHLVEFCRPDGAAERALAAVETARHLSTDGRFKAVLDALAPDAAGTVLPDDLPIRVRSGPRTTVITVDEVRANGFGRYLGERIEALYEAYRNGEGDGP